MAAALTFAVALEHQRMHTIEEVLRIARLECSQEGSGEVLGRRRIERRRS
jgi:hypothetical protein